MADPVQLSIDGAVWQASVQTAVDAWFAAHPPVPPGPDPQPPGAFDVAVALPADYTAVVTPSFPGSREPWFYGRGAGDDFNDPNGGAWESSQQPAATVSGELHNLRTDRPVTVYARTPTARVDKTVQATGALKPSTPPPSTGRSGQGIFAWDHKFATAKSLLAKYGLVTPTVDKPMLAILHLIRNNDWNATYQMFFTDWKPSGPAWRKAITVPGWPDKVAGSHAQVAGGSFDGNYRQIIRNVVATFPGEVHEYRFMHEANCCYNHRASSDPVNYKKGFDRFYGIAHEEDPTCIVVFCPIFGDGNIPIEQMEPPRLDKYALDYYGSAYDVANFVTASHGMNFLSSRGTALGVPIGLYEFGPGEWGSPHQAQTMPDDASWVDKLRAWQHDHPCDIVNYIDDTRSAEGVRSDFTVHPKCLSRWVATSTSGQ